MATTIDRTAQIVETNNNATQVELFMLQKTEERVPHGA